MVDRPLCSLNDSVAAPGSPVNSFHNGPQLQLPPLHPSNNRKTQIFQSRIWGEFEKKNSSQSAPARAHTKFAQAASPSNSTLYDLK